MERNEKVIQCLLAALSTLGSLLLRLLGGWDLSLQVLVGFMAADYISGLLLAGVFHRSKKTATGGLESRAGFKGLLRKGCILLLVCLGALLDRITGEGLSRTALCLFFTANEGLSVLENLSLMDLPVPEFLRRMLEVMRREHDEGGDQ